MAEPEAGQGRQMEGRARPVRLPFASTVFSQALMAASGAGLALFVLLHLLGNAAAYLGRAAFLAYARHLHGLGPLLPTLELCLLLLAATHVVTGTMLTLHNLQSRPLPYRVKAIRAASLSSRLMPLSGLVILLFLAVHVPAFRRPAGPSAELVRITLSRPGMATFYLLSLAALTSHLSHGLWSLFQTLGIVAPRYDQPLRRAAVLVSLLAGGVFMLLPLLALVWPDFLR